MALLRLSRLGIICKECNKKIPFGTRSFDLSALEYCALCLSKVIKAEINIDQADKSIREQAKRVTIFEMLLSWKDAEKGAFHRMASVEEGCIDNMQLQVILQSSCHGEHDNEELRHMVPNDMFNDGISKPPRGAS